MLRKGFDLMQFFKVPKNELSLFFLAFYAITAVTTLRVFKSGSPGLGIIKSV